MPQSNPFEYSLDNKRYHTLHYYNKSKGVKNQKAVINIDSSCPNIDGKKGRGGCIFCNQSSAYFSADANLSIHNQLDLEVKRIRDKWGDIAITAYFQSGTNTYLPKNKLEAYVNEIFEYGGISGISIATRPDCISKDMLDYLAEINDKTELTIELGLQTVHDKTADIINRCYTYAEFYDTFMKLKSKNIRTCIHLINGLPNESYEDMIETAKIIGEIKPEAVKIHLLHVMKDTKLGVLYTNGEYTPLSFHEYIEITANQLQYIDKNTIIERITGDAPKDKLLAPLWSKDKIKVLGSIDKYMVNQDIYQGKLAK